MKKRLFQRISTFAMLAAAVAFAAPAVPAAAQGTPSTGRDEFFIISSVNAPKHQLVLKMPTEVTMVMTVTDKTVILGEKGQQMKMGELRSGDTVYVSYTRTAQGDTAARIRLGPMTVQELHQRYLKGYSVAIPPPSSGSAPPKSNKVPHSQPTKLQRGS